MAEWRIGNGKHCVILDLGREEYALTVAQAMELVWSAPRLGGPWEQHEPCDECGCARSAVDGSALAVVYGRVNGTEDDERRWQVWNGKEYVAHGRGNTKAEAKAAADAALRAAGYLLDDGEG